MGIKDELTTGSGYMIKENLISFNLIEALNSRLPELIPVRASSSNLQYAERDNIKNLPDIAVWWSKMLLDFPEFVEIEKQINNIIKSISDSFSLYSSDIVTINPGYPYCNPHVDTPHRFPEWNFDNRLLGIQCIVALNDMTIESGVTGLVPYSQKRNFLIDACYEGKFTRWFKDNMKQNILNKGSMLMYNCRVLHSGMTNNTSNPRPALLINYCEKDIIERIKPIDNIWNSNVQI
jgi:ectoine hydroxylase-related dioxygenase (phytanoyl-CoA dioxygenase family)